MIDLDEFVYFVLVIIPLFVGEFNKKVYSQQVLLLQLVDGMGECHIQFRDEFQVKGKGAVLSM